MIFWINNMVIFDIVYGMLSTDRKQLPLKEFIPDITPVVFERVMHTYCYLFHINIIFSHVGRHVQYQELTIPVVTH